MVQSLEQYTAQANQAYNPAYSAINNQLSQLDSQLNTTNENINRQYEQQRQQLDTSRNQAAEAASLQAAGSGGSFGGAANIANRKYYENTFVPAVTQLQTNQSNALASARQASEDQRASLNSQLANLQAQANQQALSQYYSDLEAERAREAQLQAQREANAAQQAYYNAMAAAQQRSNQPLYTLQSNRNQYGGFDWIDNGTGRAVKVAQIANAAGGDFNSQLAALLQSAANQGDLYSQNVLDELSRGYKFAYNGGGNTGNAWYDTLGIRKIQDGRY